MAQAKLIYFLAHWHIESPWRPMIHQDSLGRVVSFSSGRREIASFWKNRWHSPVALFVAIMAEKCKVTVKAAPMTSPEGRRKGFSGCEFPQMAGGRFVLNHPTKPLETWAMP